MTRHLIRVGPFWLRAVLLTLWAPFYFADVLRYAALHPNKRRLLDADFWLMPWWLWVAAVQGKFVP